MSDTNQALCELQPQAESQRDVFRPAADVLETATGVEITVDLPGVKEEAIDITVERDVLTIRGTVDPVDDSEFDSLRAEFRVGNYERQFTLPENLNRDEIDATLNHGVLTLFFERIADAGPKKVTVRSA